MGYFEMDAAAKDRFIASLARNVRSLHSTLQDVTSLARLQGGQEVRELAPVDIAALLSELVEATESLAQDRKLFLRAEGSDHFMVDGDAAKIRRIAQNLALNALKYTKHGGVTLRWGNEAMNSSARWFIEVQDTGPGLQSGPGSPIAGAISVASEQARAVAVADSQGDVAHVSIEESSPEPDLDPHPDSPARVQTLGEGIGLSIVKRLCTLLDAGIEIETEPNSGTTFRVLFSQALCRLSRASHHPMGVPLYPPTLEVGRPVGREFVCRPGAAGREGRLPGKLANCLSDESSSAAMVFIAVTPAGLAEVLRRATSEDSIWCSSDAISESEHAATKRPGLTRFNYSLADLELDDGAIATVEEHHPGQSIWVEAA